jgi:hypothetical protein
MEKLNKIYFAVYYLIFSFVIHLNHSCLAQVSRLNSSITPHVPHLEFFWPLKDFTSTNSSANYYRFMKSNWGLFFNPHLNSNRHKRSFINEFFNPEGKINHLWEKTADIFLNPAQPLKAHGKMLLFRGGRLHPPREKKGLQFSSFIYLSQFDLDPFPNEVTFNDFLNKQDELTLNQFMGAHSMSSYQSPFISTSINFEAASKFGDVSAYLIDPKRVLLNHFNRNLEYEVLVPLLLFEEEYLGPLTSKKAFESEIEKLLLENCSDINSASDLNFFMKHNPHLKYVREERKNLDWFRELADKFNSK